MNIAAKIGRAFRVVNEDLPLVVLAGIGTTFLTGGGALQYLSMAAFVFSIAVGIALYGRIVARLSSQNPETTLTIIRDNWFNCLLVLLLLGVPIWVVGAVARELAVGVAGYAVIEVARASLAALTIYVVPIVYMKHESLVAILAGIAYFVRNCRASVWIAIVAALAYLVGAARYIMLINLQPPLLLVAVAATGVGATYINFLAFAAASDMLIGEGSAASA